MVAASALIGTSLTVVGEPVCGWGPLGRGPRQEIGHRRDGHREGLPSGPRRRGLGPRSRRLTALAGSQTGAPALVAATASPPVVVMEDLGPGDSVATVLLAPDPLAAGQAVVDWAEALADLHAATWNNVGRFVVALSDLGGSGPPNPQAMPDVLTDGVERLREGPQPDGYRGQRAGERRDPAIAARLGAEVYVLSPFDACPDNNIRTATGLRFIDFEGATVAHPAWDVAYLRVPWPSCLVRLADARYRRRTGPAGLARAASSWNCAQRYRTWLVSNGCRDPSGVAGLVSGDGRLVPTRRHGRPTRRGRRWLARPCCAQSCSTV